MQFRSIRQISINCSAQKKRKTKRKLTGRGKHGQKKLKGHERWAHSFIESVFKIKEKKPFQLLAHIRKCQNIIDSENNSVDGQVQKQSLIIILKLIYLPRSLSSLPHSLPPILFTFYCNTPYFFSLSRANCTRNSNNLP